MRQYFAALILLIATIVGCSAKKFGVETLCKPGETGAPVVCADGSQGFLVCDDEGEAFDKNNCGPGSKPTTGCGSDSASCISGQTFPCACPDGRDGMQSCNTSCSGLDACICTGNIPGAGGTTGQGGNINQGGSAGQGGSNAAGSGGTADQGGASQGGSSGNGGTSGQGGVAGSNGGAGGSPQCIENETESCNCDGQLVGVKTCKNGTFGNCECPSGAGGASGQGGSSGSSGTGGTSGQGGSAGMGGSSGECVTGTQINCDCNGQLVGIKKCQNGAYGTCECPSENCISDADCISEATYCEKADHKCHFKGTCWNSTCQEGTHFGSVVGVCVCSSNDPDHCSHLTKAGDQCVVQGAKCCANGDGWYTSSYCPTGDSRVDFVCDGSTWKSTGTCYPGQSYACACAGGVIGQQICNSDGKSFGDCSCSDAGAGGAGGSAGSGGSGGSGGSAQLVTVNCEITHRDNTLTKFDLNTGKFSTTQHVYRVFVSDEGIDLNGLPVFGNGNENHVKWGEDAKLNVQQLGRSVKISFTTALGNRIKMNATRDPVGTDLGASAYWQEPACSRTPLRPIMEVDCTVNVNGSTSHMPWPVSVANGEFGCDLWTEARPTVTSSTDQDGDGATVSEDCNDNDYYKRGSPISDLNKWNVEVMQDGVDNDCVGGDAKYRRVVMDSSVASSAKFWDFWKYNVAMTISGSRLVSEYYPSNLMPQDTMSGQSKPQPAGLVQWSGSGSNCYNGSCWNMVDSGSCVEVYPVFMETSDNTHVSAIPARNAENKCRVFFPSAE